MSMLEISNLTATAGDKDILKGINLTVNAGEVHAIMGPNGSGKSTLAQVLAGHPSYEVTGGSVMFEGEDLLELEPEVRAHKGVFLAFQYPIEIPGVSNAYFLRSAYNAMRVARGGEEVDPMEFLDVMEEKLKIVEMDDAMLARSVNMASRVARRSATRFCRWRYWNRSWPSLTKRTRGSTSMPCGWWPRV